MVPEPELQAPVKAPSDDELLLTAASQGDPGARQVLYERFASVVHGIALAQVGVQDAEDLTQEVFVAVFRRLPTVRDFAAFPGWICTVARNMAIDLVRRRRRRPSVQELGDPPAMGVEDAAHAGLAERVFARLQQLPTAYRETLMLRLVEGLTGPEIAARTGLTPGSVRVNLCRGMAMLRPLLEQEGWHAPR